MTRNEFLKATNQRGQPVNAHVSGRVFLRCTTTGKAFWLTDPLTRNQGAVCIYLAMSFWPKEPRPQPPIQTHISSQYNCYRSCDKNVKIVGQNLASEDSCTQWQVSDKQVKEASLNKYLFIFQ